eukprot:gene1557-1696_t
MLRVPTRNVKQTVWLLHGSSIRSIQLQAMPCVEYSANLDWSDIYNKGQPLLITNLAQCWPAVQPTSGRHWSNLKGLRDRIDSSHEVVVEMGKTYMDPNVQRVTIEFVRFLDLLIEEEADPSITQDLPPLYCAQNDCQTVSGLLEDLETPLICQTGKGHRYSTMFWLNGMRGSMSPCHYDPYHNLLVQIYGEKEVTLFSPQQSSKLYPAVGTLQKNTAQIDVNAPDFKQFPLASELEGVRCTLKAGDALYMPFKWWHHCQTRSRSFSVNFWWL